MYVTYKKHWVDNNESDLTLLTRHIKYYDLILIGR